MQPLAALDCPPFSTFSRTIHSLALSLSLQLSLSLVHSSSYICSGEYIKGTLCYTIMRLQR